MATVSIAIPTIPATYGIDCRAVIDVIGRALGLLFGIGLAVYLMQQVRKPSRWIGPAFAALMNRSHARLRDWGLKHIQIGREWTILDVGCGGGRTVGLLQAAAPDGHVVGIDYAAGSVGASRRHNAHLVAAGRVRIQQAAVSALPFADNTFDLVTAVETQYYWPDLINDMREVLRVLKPGGSLLVMLESCKREGLGVDAAAMKLLRGRVLGASEQRDLFTRAGFDQVDVSVAASHGWLCAVGRKPGRL